jgi:small-conductance mechanosensitive channel
MTQPSWLSYTFYGNPLRDWAQVVAYALGAAVVFSLLRRFVFRRFDRPADKTGGFAGNYLLVLLDAVQPTLLVAITLRLAERFLDFPARVDKIALWVMVAALVLQVFTWINRSVDFWVGQYERQHGDAGAKTALTVLAFVARMVLWAIAILTALEALHVQITGLLAGLGIGGIAVALAMQNMLGDLFGALSIVLDKPFLVGDVIAVDQLEGTVEHIGLKTTRVKSVNGEQLIFSNGDLLRSRVRNLSRRDGRRLMFTLSVAPGTTAAQLARVPVIIAEIVAADPRATLQRTHLTGTGVLGFEVETAILIPHPEATLAFDARQAILLALYARLEKEKIELARPTTAAVAHTTPTL